MVDSTVSDVPRQSPTSDTPTSGHQVHTLHGHGHTHTLDWIAFCARYAFPIVYCCTTP